MLGGDFQGRLKGKSPRVFTASSDSFKPVKLPDPPAQPSGGARSQRRGAEEPWQGDAAKVDLGTSSCALYRAGMHLRSACCVPAKHVLPLVSPLSASLRTETDLPLMGGGRVCPVSESSIWGSRLPLPHFSQVPPAGKGNVVWQPPAGFFFFFFCKGADGPYAQASWRLVYIRSSS